LHIAVSSRLWGLLAEEDEGLEAGAVPAQVAVGGGAVRIACAVEDADDDVGDRGEHPTFIKLAFSPGGRAARRLWCGAEGCRLARVAAAPWCCCWRAQEG
jgi:hypothetical protein